MSHEITEKDGLALNRVAAWHGLGTVVQEDMDPIKAMEIANLGWGVSMVKGVQAITKDGEEVSTDRYQALIRNDTNDILAVHGGQYQPIQNEVLFDLAYAANSNVKVESAGSFDEGRRVFVLLRGDSIHVNKTDESVPYLALTNSHDGSSRMIAVPTTVRVVCNNTLSLMFHKDGKRGYAISHSGDMGTKIADLRRALNEFAKDQTTWDQNVAALTKKTMDHTELLDFWGAIYARRWGIPKTAKEQESALDIIQGWEANLETERASLAYPDVDAWLAANAVSQYIQHRPPQRVKNGWEERRLESNWFKTGASDTAAVFQQALKLV